MPLNAFLDSFFDVIFEDLIVIVFSFLHPLNAWSPIFVVFAGSVIPVRTLQPLNAYAPISVTFCPIVTVLSFIAPLKAFLEILLTLLPIVTFVTFLLFLKAPSEICVTLYFLPLIFTVAGMLTVLAFLFTGALYATVFLDVLITWTFAALLSSETTSPFLSGFTIGFSGVGFTGVGSWSFAIGSVLVFLQTLQVYVFTPSVFVVGCVVTFPLSHVCPVAFSSSVAITSLHSVHL